MLAREAVLSDPEVVRLLSKHFVCFAIDNADHSNTTPKEREWLKPLGGRASTQGMSAFTAGGQALAGGGGFEAEPVRKMLKAALAKFKPEAPPTIEKDKDRETALQPPEGGLVLYVTWKVLEGEKLLTPKSHPHEKHFLNALGADRLWVRKDEAEALAKGELPASLRKRMAIHLRYILPGKLKTDGMKLEGGRLSGALLSDSGERADTLGFIESKDGKVTRFELVIKGLGGNCGEHGFEGALTAVPKGVNVPVALGFILANPNDELSRTLPHRLWNNPGYLK